MSGLTEAEKKVLEAGGFDLTPRNLGSKDPVHRTQDALKKLCSDSVDVTRAAAMLGLTEDCVLRRIAERTLYSFTMGSYGPYIPSFQFEGNRLLPSLGEVVQRLDPGLHPVSVQHWFLTPNPDLCVTDERPLSPREWLLKNYPVEEVASLAGDL